MSYGKIIEKNSAEKKGVTPESFDTYQGVHPGDIVLRLTDLQNDQKSLRVAYADTHGIITSAYLSVRGKGLHPKFAAYLLHDIGDIQKAFYSLGGGVRQSMKFADLAEILVPKTPRDEQGSIAAWLDIQTHRIDKRRELLGKKRELLRELRQSLIHETVISGQANAQWNVVRIKDVAKINPPTKLPSTGVIEFFPMDSIGIDGGLASAQSKNVEEASGYSQFRNGDVLFAKVTPCFENGKSAIGEKLSGIGALATTEVTILRPTKAILPPFLHYRIKGRDFTEMGKNEMKGSGGLKRVPEKHVANFRFQIPDIDRQQAIVDRLDQKVAQVDEQIALIDQLDELLQQQRKAIIHEAVTGKIDLSAYEPPTQAA